MRLYLSHEFIVAMLDRRPICPTSGADNRIWTCTLLARASKARMSTIPPYRHIKGADNPLRHREKKEKGNALDWKPIGDSCGIWTQHYSLERAVTLPVSRRNHIHGVFFIISLCPLEGSMAVTSSTAPHHMAEIMSRTRVLLYRATPMLPI